MWPYCSILMESVSVACEALTSYKVSYAITWFTMIVSYYVECMIKHSYVQLSSLLPDNLSSLIRSSMSTRIDTPVF